MKQKRLTNLYPHSHGTFILCDANDYTDNKFGSYIIWLCLIVETITSEARPSIFLFFIALAILKIMKYACTPVGYFQIPGFKVMAGFTSISILQMHQDTWCKGHRNK